MTDWLQIFLDVENKKPISVNLQELIKSRALLQANSGGGKSHAMRKGIEEAHGKVQQIIIDPEGEFHTLREKFAFLLIGKGSQADIQIDSKHAALLAKKVMETGADVIIDLYELNPFERIRFVKLFCEALVNLPKHLWHQCLIWLDEIHVFAPESKSGRSESLAAVAALASRGRKRGYGLIGATQRISKLNKDVAAELNTKFIGRCSLDIDRKRAGEELGIKDTTNLRKLKHEFYAFGPAIADDNVLVKAYETKTSHEEIGSIKEYIPANKGKISGFLKNFTELPQEAELDLKTKEGLETKVQELQIKLRQAEKLQPKQDPQALETAYQRGILFGEKQSKEIINTQEKYIQSIKHNAGKIKQAITELQSKTNHDFDLILMTAPDIPEPQKVSTIIQFEKPQEVRINNSVKTETVTMSLVNSGVVLNKCADKCLKTLAGFNKPLSRKKLAVYSGYSPKSGGYGSAIISLREGGYVTESNKVLTITPFGFGFAGGSPSIPTNHDDLLQHWKGKLSVCPAKLLEKLCEIHPNSVSRQELAMHTGYSPGSGGFNGAVIELKDLGLAEESDKQVKASEAMFP